MVNLFGLTQFFQYLHPRSIINWRIVGI